MGSEFDANYTRLKSIIILFLIVFFIYACEVMILGTGDEKFSTLGSPFLPDNAENVPKTQPNIIDGIGKTFTYISAFFFFVFQMITFTLPSIPLWMTVIMLPIMIVMIIILVYLVVDTIYAIVKAFPLT